MYQKIGSTRKKKKKAACKHVNECNMTWAIRRKNVKQSLKLKQGQRTQSFYSTCENC